ncbi:single-stranded DNA-binding protein [Candidatus Nanoperiomorbus periodonticus]|uniref:single-stranded DNA-binding protein n=1 Tax=Candidatus Nanoperiomorbus periodonticus TaxID=2171989 RepID=UPI00101D5DCF|nr:single-stranded DNA-binding protein [Candidatus Nanoperiomorbus periodonticus]RYC76298.1 Single-stranded DNA-binding protein [Candidatus Nanoperiomorbus periodonticus]
MAFNKVILMGNLTADPEVRTTPSGQSVTSFSLAVNRTFRGSDGNRREETSFINCTAWGNTGETIAKYVGKGRQLLVSGRLQQRSWEDKETGKRRSAIDVIVEEFSFVNDGRGSGANAAAGSQKASSQPSADTAEVDADEPIDLSDIPF